MANPARPTDVSSGSAYHGTPSDRDRLMVRNLYRAAEAISWSTTHGTLHIVLGGGGVREVDDSLVEVRGRPADRVFVRRNRRVMDEVIGWVRTSTAEGETVAFDTSSGHFDRVERTPHDDPRRVISYEVTPSGQLRPAGEYREPE